MIRSVICRPFPVCLSRSTAAARGKTAGPDIRFPLVCWFRTAFSADVVPSKLSLVMDRSAILGNYQIYLNGVRLPGKGLPSHVSL